MGILLIRLQRTKDSDSTSTNEVKRTSLARGSNVRTCTCLGPRASTRKAYIAHAQSLISYTDMIGISVQDSHRLQLQSYIYATDYGETIPITYHTAYSGGSTVSIIIRIMISDRPLSQILLPD